MGRRQCRPRLPTAPTPACCSVQTSSASLFCPWCRRAPMGAAGRHSSPEGRACYITNEMLCRCQRPPQPSSLTIKMVWQSSLINVSGWVGSVWERKGEEIYCCCRLPAPVQGAGALSPGIGGMSPPPALLPAGCSRAVLETLPAWP